MLGVSLPFKWLLSGEGELGERAEVLRALRERGVKSIELRTVRPYHTATQALAAAKMLWDMGFWITVHGQAKSLPSAIQDVFAPLEELLAARRQPSLTIVLHPIDGDNAAVLRALSTYAEQQGYPVRFALENNRLLPSGEEGDCAALVLDAVKRAERENVGICFDMGHYMYHVRRNCPHAPDTRPSKEFFKHVIHTHIHALNGLITHFPLDTYELPLRELLDAVTYEYFGIYDLELDFPRIVDVCDPRDALYSSLEYLKKALPHTARLYGALRENFDREFHTALSVLEKTEQGTHFSLVQSSAYLFCTNGYPWAMDIAFRHAASLAKTPSEVGALLAPLRLMLLTHEHRDHFEEQTLRALAENALTFVVPEFLAPGLHSLGVPPERCMIARAGESLRVGPLTVLPFESRHFRPITGKGVREYGYHVSAENAPSLLFPADIRDFSMELQPRTPPADYCFANVFLGDGRAMEEPDPTAARDFAAYMLHFGAERVVLTHLYESGRADADMWREEHALCIADEMKGMDPAVRVLIPKRGEVFKL